MRTRILIVDDEPLDTTTLVATIQNRFPDVAVDVARSASRALSLIARMSYDVILCDPYLPSGGGATVLTTTRRLWPKAVVIMLTNGDMAEEDEAAARGTGIVISKPYELDHLLAVVTRVVDQTTGAEGHA